MHDNSSRTSDDALTPVSPETAIALIEAGDASPCIRVDLGDGIIARADGRHGLKGLLQRLRGHRLIQSLACSDAPDAVLPMRLGEIDVHPDVAEILDALRLD